MNGFQGKTAYQRQLTERLGRPLPGRAAQTRFAPQLGYGRHFGPPPPDARQAAVMVLFCGQDDAAFLPLTLRPGHLKQHSGQICFPGGMLEDGETCEAAAMRETHEEIGIPPDSVELLGRLSPLLVFASNNCITPVVGRLRGPADFELNPDEVDALLRVPIGELVDPEHHGRSSRSVAGVEFEAPYVLHQEHQIWGATSMILGELMAVLNAI